MLVLLANIFPPQNADKMKGKIDVEVSLEKDGPNRL